MSGYTYQPELGPNKHVAYETCHDQQKAFDFPYSTANPVLYFTPTIFPTPGTPTPETPSSFPNTSGEPPRDTLTWGIDFVTCRVDITGNIQFRTCRPREGTSLARLIVHHSVPRSQLPGRWVDVVFPWPSESLGSSTVRDSEIGVAYTSSVSRPWTLVLYD